MTSVLWFLFSTGGVLTLLLIVCGWIVARPASRTARATVVVVTLGYTVISIDPFSRAAAALIGRGFGPLSRADVPPGAVLVAVLGSGSYSMYDWSHNQAAALYPDGLARALEAVRVYRLIDPQWVVCSGGPPDDRGDRPSAEEVKRVLVDFGVPATRIIARNDTRTTRDEAVMVAGLLPSLGAERVVVVTSALHMRRAAAAFRTAGLQVVPAPARPDEGSLSWRLRVLPSELGLHEAADVIHELAGIVVYRLRGWIQ